MTAKSKTVLITGSTDGVGRYVAERLAAEGWRVIVHGRDRIRGEAVVERIAKQGGEARLLTADLASLAEVRSLADAVLRDEAGLDALVNNAGIGTSGSRRELSADGLELRFAVNYLAGFLLTRLLLPMLESRKPARIVNVSSAGQQAIDFSDVMLTRGCRPHEHLLPEQARANPVQLRISPGTAGSGVFQLPASGNIK